MNDVQTMLYVGGFVLPDGNAAAQRVVANAKLFSNIGYNIVFLNYSDDILTPRKTNYFGFECFECPKAEWDIASRMDTDRIEEILEARRDIRFVVAYNYPALSLARLIKICRQKNVLCIGDVTEWYRARDVAFPKSLLKYIDTTIRMRILQPRMDGLIVISSYLENYYSTRVPTVLLPPLVDISENKWASIETPLHDGLWLVYAGKPSKTKERLDLVAKAVVNLPNTVSIRLDVVGITAEEFLRIYGYAIDDDRVVFHGRVSHDEALGYVKRADYSIIVRDDNRVTRAGFPTKFVESISCGTPVICNDNSDLKAWVKRTRCGYVTTENTLLGDIKNLDQNNTTNFRHDHFDFHRFSSRARSFFEQIDKRKG
ncbi:glycosyltransferase [Olsenella sp. An290]|uniref:glycosyltransferase n=1 Tax=Olsenella sp. An290 TaxID=1965625 RepID=UPI000B39702D|nr:glycosyltransferase [Olsenella sp. An290]OUO34805.1 hypothetical protein B5F84_05400 [Olsenella sp. An290]